MHNWKIIVKKYKVDGHMDKQFLSYSLIQIDYMFFQSPIQIIQLIIICD